MEPPTTRRGTRRTVGSRGIRIFNAIEQKLRCFDAQLSVRNVYGREGWRKPIDEERMTRERPVRFYEGCALKRTEFSRLKWRPR